MITITNLKDSRFENIEQEVLEFLSPGRVWLAGGALRSMLISEDVADYDLFFADNDVLNTVRALLEQHDFVKVFECPKGELFSYVRGNRDDGDYIKVQCINKRKYKNASDLISSFDFTVCMAAFDGQTLTVDPRFIRHTKRKRLAFGVITYPVATINRLHKYRVRGYIPYEQDLVELVTQINGNNWSPEEMALYVD